jgi:hypothetical protein
VGSRVGKLASGPAGSFHARPKHRFCARPPHAAPVISWRRYRQRRQLAQATDGAAVVDAPCGFAIPGETCRDTEIAAHVAIYRTPTSLAFHQGLQRFGGSNNAAPLRQRYYWKLVGFAVYRWLAERALGHVVIPPCEGLASLCLQQTSPRLREGFPSLTYVRAQWGCLPPAALCVLDDLVQAEWMGVPPAPGGHPLNPPLATLRRLITLRRAPLINELAHPGDLSSMCKAEDDPIWGDLWDAFTLAFVGRCEDYGAARFFRGGRGRETQEGAILSA